MEKRYFKVKKETPNFKAGVIFAQIGGGNYKPLSEAKHTYPANSMYLQEVVENEPEWFEEVFKAYLTKEEQQRLSGKVTPTVKRKGNYKGSMSPEGRAAVSRAAKLMWKRKKAAQRRAERG